MRGTVTNSLHTYRGKADLTQSQLADEVGVSRQTIIAIEKGNYTPSVALALCLASYFNVTVEDIFTYEE